MRTNAYALVEVDQIQVCAPLTGLIESMGVMEDGDYEAGTIAFSLEDRDARNELETPQLQLRLIESRLTERATSVKLSRADRLYERDELIARRRAELGEARVEEARLSAPGNENHHNDRTVGCSEVADNVSRRILLAP
ncbi:MAG: hypothetical protein ACYTFA_11295 [Planctomycetota bacterium]